MAIKERVGSKRHDEPADNEPTVEERLTAFERRTPEELARDRERIFAASRPPRPLPPGKTLEDVIVGALPDDKSEQEILEALAELS